jgi:PAS domain S-box-containing protein
MPRTVEASPRFNAGFDQADGYRGLFEFSPDAIVAWNSDGIIQSVNKAAAVLLGYDKAGELVGRRWLDFVVPDDRPARARATRRAEKSGGLAEAEFSMQRKDGSCFPVEGRLFAALDGAGNPVQTIAIARDVTARKTMETALLDRERAYRELFELSPDAIVAWNADGIIQTANMSAPALLGYDKAEDLIGKNWTDFIIPEYLPDLVARVRSAEASGGLAEAQFEAKRKDGGRVFAEARLKVTLDSVGNPVHNIVIVRDITQRKQAEAAIYLSEARFRSTFEAAGHGMALVDLDGRFIKVNAAFCRLTGYSEDELLARSYADLTHPEDLAECAKGAQLMGRGEIPSFEMEKRYVRKDGGIVWVQLNVSMVHDAAGAPVHQVAQVQDITDREAAFSRLRRLNRTLRNLIAADTAVVHATTEQELLSDMCRIGVEPGGYPLVWIGFVEHDEAKSVRPVAWAGEHLDCVHTANVTWADDERGRGPTGTAIRTGQAQIVQNVETDPVMAPWRADLLQHGLKASVALPLKSKSEVFGAITFYAGEPDAFGSEEVDLLKELADDLAYGIEARRDRSGREAALAALEGNLKLTVQAVANAAEMHDVYTAGHERHVANLSVAIARELGLTEFLIEGLYLAGLIHDVGKINVPAEFLSKPGKLTPLEYQVIQTHVQAGYDIIKGVDFPWPVGQSILQHHERLDGSGYPNHLKGDAITIEGRILGVADVVDAMQSHRPYREALGLDAALAEIEAGRGRLYDPAVVDACVALFRQKGFRFL